MTSNLRLTNPSQKSVFFKVKTTAPRFYCVRPNSGVIKPAESTVINVMLQPIDQNSVAENERARHKFMIQVMFVFEREERIGGVKETSGVCVVFENIKKR